MSPTEADIRANNLRNQALVTRGGASRDGLLVREVVFVPRAPARNRTLSMRRSWPRPKRCCGACRRGRLSAVNIASP
jgi:hypothetical protein